MLIKYLGVVRIKYVGVVRVGIYIYTSKYIYLYIGACTKPVRLIRSRESVCVTIYLINIRSNSAFLNKRIPFTIAVSLSGETNHASAAIARSHPPFLHCSHPSPSLKASIGLRSRHSNTIESRPLMGRASRIPHICFAPRRVSIVIRIITPLSARIHPRYIREANSRAPRAEVRARYSVCSAKYPAAQWSARSNIH